MPPSGVYDSHFQISETLVGRVLSSIVNAPLSEANDSSKNVTPPTGGVGSSPPSPTIVPSSNIAVDNATTPLPRLVTLKGTLVKNTWGLPGLKEVTTAILEDGTIIGEGGDEPTPPVDGVTFFEESFASDKGTFTIEDKTRPT